MKDLRPYHHFLAINQRANCPQIAFPISVDIPEDNLSDIHFIQGVLGHNSSRTTERYTHVSKRVLERVESPIDKIVKDKSTYNKHFNNFNRIINIKEISEPGSDIQ